MLSEFGGVFPFLIALPVTFAKITSSVGVAWRPRPSSAPPCSSTTGRPSPSRRAFDKPSARPPCPSSSPPRRAGRPRGTPLRSDGPLGLDGSGTPGPGRPVLHVPLPPARRVDTQAGLRPWQSRR
ncbi:hypothetical protein NKG94_10090 [Micromonospora sp. M12]